MREFKKRGYLYVTIMFFAIAWLVHGITAYNQFADEQKEHGQPLEINAFWNEFLRQTAKKMAIRVPTFSLEDKLAYDIIRSCITAGPLR